MQKNEEINQKMNHLLIRNLIALVILRIMNQNPKKNLKMKVIHQRQILLKIRVKNLLQKNLIANLIQIK
jgi:hypothetical protein